MPTDTDRTPHRFDKTQWSVCCRLSVQSELAFKGTASLSMCTYLPNCEQRIGATREKTSAFWLVETGHSSPTKKLFVLELSQTKRVKPQLSMQKSWIDGLFSKPRHNTIAKFNHSERSKTKPSESYERSITSSILAECSFFFFLIWCLNKPQLEVCAHANRQTTTVK